MKNWKTTLIGTIGAAIVAAYQLYESLNGAEVDLKALIGAATLAALGYLAKDAGVTGTQK